MNRQTDQYVMLQRFQAIIRERKGLVGCGLGFSAALHSRGKLAYAGSDRWGQGEGRDWSEVTSLICDADEIVALLSDGTLRFAGRQAVDSRFAGLSHVRTVACTRGHMAALLGNGRVIVGGERPLAFHTEISEWPSVRDICCGARFTAGLTADGQVTIAGGSRHLRTVVGTWKDITGIFTDFEGNHLYAVNQDGRLFATTRLPRAVRNWKGLVYVAVYRDEIWGISTGGQLRTNKPGLANTDLGRHFVACAVSDRHAVALSRDGHVSAWGENDFGQCDTRRFGALFNNFEEFAAEHRERMKTIETAERNYQRSLTAAARYSGHLVCSERITACTTADGRVMTTAGFGNVKQWNHIRALACGNAHLVALREGGTVLADGNNTEGCTEVESWRDVKAVAAGKYHTLGLTEDGRVLFCGRNQYGQGDVTEWTDVRRLYAADTYTVGLRIDGTLTVAGMPPFDAATVNAQWNGAVDVVVTDTHMIALYPDGTVLSTREIPAGDKPGDGSVWDTCSWRSVRAIAAGHGFSVGLCYGGRVVAAGTNERGRCEVDDWRNVVAVACGNTYTVGLTADGHVLLAGELDTDRDSDLAADPEVDSPAKEISRWHDVLAISAGPSHTVAMTAEGQVLACGPDGDGQCSATAGFALFRDIRQLYGYGNYRKQTEEPTAPVERHAITVSRECAEGQISPFRAFASHLREDTNRIRARLAGSDVHLSFIDSQGDAVTYLYENAGSIRDTGGTLARLAASPDSTVLIYADGTACERKDLSGETGTAALPNRLGGSPFYRVRDVATGDDHRAFLLEDGTVRSFGDNDRDQCETSSWSRIKAVAAGSEHTVGLREDGTCVATGARRRESGNRARGVAHLPRANPCAVSDWTGVKEILCALDVTVGLCYDGTVRAVGNRNYGQCNTEGWRDVVSVATSGRHTAALFADGHVEAVGLNESGECRTEGWERIIQIAVLPEVTLGLRADGRVMAAGRCSGTLSQLDTVHAMACFGLRRQVFVTYSGEIYIHTRGSDLPPERLKDLKVIEPTVEDSILTRHTRGTLPSVAARALKGSFAVGMGHTLYLGEKGTLMAAGANEGGQCDILTYRTAVSVSAGHYHSAAVLPDGRAVLSGRGSEGQCDARSLHLELSALELTAEGNRSAAEIQDAPLVYAWRRLVCGYAHTAALRSDGRVYAVGNNIDGRCDTRKWRNVVDLACGIRHTVACSADGSCVAVGDDRYGQCGVSDWREIVMVAAGEFHTVGLTADGRVVAVGDNSKGQCDLSDLTEVVSIACLPEATLCVLADGSVTIRGGSGEHNRAIGALREIVAVNTCEHRVVALTADRRLLTLPSPQVT